MLIGVLFDKINYHEDEVSEEYEDDEVIVDDALLFLRNLDDIR